MTESLSELFGEDPIARPLTYPGRIPTHSGILVDDCYLGIRPDSTESVEKWLIEVSGQRLTLGEYLEDLGLDGMDARHPVVAVGSNASPSQMRRKFVTRSTRAVIPMTIADVHGISPGVSAHINKAGYIPAAPVTSPRKVSPLFVLWLNDEQLKVLDITEPNYYRCLMPEEDFPVFLPSGDRIRSCHVYISKHGCLIDSMGPRCLMEQPVIIQSLLDESVALRSLCGATPAEFVASVIDAETREAAYQIFRSEEWVRPQPELVALRGTPS